MKRVCARNRLAAALWLLIEADQSYIPSWHFKYDIVLLCVLIGKESKRDRVRRRKSKAERHSSKLHDAKYINISIWCLILPPPLLTPLASVAPITGLEWALPGQGHVVGVCCESATWTQRCLWGPGARTCWQGGSSDSIVLNWQEARLNHAIWVTHTHKVTPFCFPGFSFLSPYLSLSGFFLYNTVLSGYKLSNTDFMCLYC